MAGVRWSETEIQYLKDNYVAKNSCAKIAKYLGRTVRAVYTKADRLGLKVQWDYERVDKDGYIEVVLGSSVKQRKHRYVYEQYHKIKLNSKEHIHHLDEDKRNNNIENLVCVSPANHNVLHAMIIKRDVEGLFEFKKHLLPHDIHKYESWLSTFL